MGQGDTDIMFGFSSNALLITITTSIIPMTATTEANELNDPPTWPQGQELGVGIQKSAVR